MNYNKAITDNLNEWLELLSVELGIQKSNIILTKQYDSCYVFSSNAVYINLDQANRLQVDPLIILAHELRHAWQYQNKMLIGIGERDRVMWMGQIYSKDYSSRESHAQLPWEADAIRYEQTIAQRMGIMTLIR